MSPFGEKTDEKETKLTQNWSASIMSLDAELNMCLFKNCLIIDFMRRNLFVIIVISEEQWPLHSPLSHPCLLFVTPQGVFLPRFPHHSPASSCLFLQGQREKLTSCKMLAVWKDAFKRPLLKLMYTDSGCHHQCCGVYGFVVCCLFWSFFLFVPPPHNGCLAGILLFGISLSLSTSLWQCRR